MGRGRALAFLCFSRGCHESSDNFKRLSVYARWVALNCVDMVWSVRACRPVARKANDANSAYTRKQVSHTSAVWIKVVGSPILRSYA